MEKSRILYTEEEFQNAISFILGITNFGKLAQTINAYTKENLSAYALLDYVNDGLLELSEMIVGKPLIIQDDIDFDIYCGDYLILKFEFINGNIELSLHLDIPLCTTKKYNKNNKTI